MDFAELLATVAQTTPNALREWFLNRFLGNIDLVVILGLLRMWSKSEHRKTAEQLRKAREELAATVASTAEVTAHQASKENAEILAQVKTNTDISTQAFQEANAVNQKIAALRQDQNDLRREQGT